MLSYVQKETLSTLINLYQSSGGRPVKGEDIADAINKNSGSIRNQMVYLKQLGLVKSTAGPFGGYKPTIEAYHTLNISVSDNDYSVPVYKNGKKIKDMSVARIKFTGLSQDSGCEVSIKIIGNIKFLNMGDEIAIGPTPVNNLCVRGIIVGRDDSDNLLLVDSKTIISIPKKTVGEIATRDVTLFSIDYPIKNAAKKLTKKEIGGAPVTKDGEVVGIFTLTDLVKSITNDEKYDYVGELMSTDFVIVNENLKLENAIEIMLKNSISRLIVANDNQSLIGVVTRTDIIDNMINLNQFPISHI